MATTTWKCPCRRPTRTSCAVCAATITTSRRTTSCPETARAYRTPTLSATPGWLAAGKSASDQRSEPVIPWTAGSRTGTYASKTSSSATTSSRSHSRRVTRSSRQHRTSDRACWTCASAFHQTSVTATHSMPMHGNAAGLGSKLIGRTSQTAKECTAPEARTIHHVGPHAGGHARTTISSGPADGSVSPGVSASQASSGTGITAFHPASVLWPRDGPAAWSANPPFTPLQPCPRRGLCTIPSHAHSTAS